MVTGHQAEQVEKALQGLKVKFVRNPDFAALCARGTSTIANAGQIERGYERIDERLNALGARITRIEQ